MAQTFPQITPNSLRLIAELDEFKGQWKMLKTLSPERLDVLRTVATIESIGSSTRIEGSLMSDADVEKLLSGLESDSFRLRDQQEVRGYATAMSLVFDAFAEIPLSENHIKQLHGVLLQMSTKDERHRGEYKKLPNHVEAYDADGKRIGVVFQTASPFETPMRMTELMDWTRRAFENAELHPLLIIAVFIIHFLAIHPFQDGNGRLSRELTSCLLLRSGYTYVPYASLERVIEENKDKYYLALRTSQKNMGTEDEDLEPWIQFFLNSLKKQKDVLSKKIEREGAFLRLPPLSQQILELAKEHGQISNAQVQAATQANRNTIKVHLARLVEQGLLVKSGQGKATKYTINQA